MILYKANAMKYAWNSSTKKLVFNSDIFTENFS